MTALLNSLRVRLILLVLLAVIPALGLTFYSGIEQRRQARLDAFRQALELAKKISNDQDHLIERTHQLLVALAQMPQVLQCQSSGYSPVLARLLKEYPFYTNLGTTGPDGQVNCSALAMKQPTNFADGDWFPRILHTRKFTVSNYILGRISRKAIIVLSYPILAGTEHLKGVIFVGLDLDWLNQIFAKTQIPPGSVLVVFDRKGTILARYPDPEKWTGRNISDTPIVKTILIHRGEGTVEMAGLDDIVRLYGFAPLSNSAEVGAYVAAGIPSTAAFAESNQILFRNLTLLGLASILALVVAWWFGSLVVVDPMNGLLNTTKRLTDGDLTIRTGSSYPRGEIGQLARSFDQMAESLEHRETERKRAEEASHQSEEKYRVLINNIPDITWSADSEGHTIFISPRVKEAYGYTPEEIYADHELWLGRVHPGDIERVMIAFKSLFTENKKFDIEYRIKRKDGLWIWLHDRSINVREKDGKRYADGVFTDVTERKRAERALGESEKEAKRLAQENTVMAEIGRIISSTLNIKEVYERFAEEARKLIPFDRIMVALNNLGEDSATVTYASGLEFEGRKIGNIYPIAHSLHEEVMRTRAGLLIQPESVGELEGRFPILIPTFQAGLRSMMSVPLISQDHVIGALHVRSKKTNAYTDRDLKLAERIADQIAGAIANAQLFLERKRAEEALKKSEERFRELYDNAPVGYFEYDSQGHITNVNRTELEMLGYTPEEMIGQPVWKFIAGKKEARQQILAKLAGTMPPDRGLERIYRRKDGTTFPVLVENRLLQDEKGRITGIRATIQDITERKTIEEKILASLREKEVMLKEIHHRVKNNLQLISSLLNLQSRYIQNPPDKEIFRESQNRVRSMALLHEKLYQSSDLAKIEIRDYVQQLATHLFTGHESQSGRIVLKVEVKDVFLGVDKAIPCGLIINELVSNALKYAFPPGGKGEIGIAFSLGPESRFTLKVWDNGVGFPEGLDFSSTETLGLQLVNTLTAQLEGSIELNRAGGTEFEIRFKA